MGTNYYLHTEEKPPCNECGRGYESEPRHIGKSSCGWVFSLHIYPEEGIHDLPDWERLWSAPNTYILDEYGTRTSVEKMRAVITERRHKEAWNKAPFMYNSWEEFHQQNGSMQGPHGLLRARRAMKHGEGTWDCHDGDFS